MARVVFVGVVEHAPAVVVDEGFRRRTLGHGDATKLVNKLNGTVTRLAAVVQSRNRAAARVLEKTGFALIEHRAVRLPSGGKRDCGFYLRER